ncbi:PD-(D/E)XK nuclease-like domain-containing protein [Paenibacillus pinihumi]|uniref:PD-(D/E)XK nuclease-like domain-containing protein n=1 Tax=Paenibacillus pinihumi TaxID=669462 RepID=UPI0003F75032|nr:PD-(D/E)XK nuclease-like domain-containing protein [Paenibacillus pinihumi]
MSRQPEVCEIILNRDNYFSLEANRHYMSVSQFKSFVPAYGGCEARSVAELAGDYTRPDKGAFNEGHYIHAWNSNELAEFKENNPDIYSSRGDTKGQLKSNYKHLNKMIEVLEDDPLVMQVLAGHKEVILTAELFGIPWKVMLDSYQPEIGDTGAFADLKALKDMKKSYSEHHQNYVPFYQKYGYDLQMAIYAEVERIVKKREHWIIPHLVVVTKQDPPDHEIIMFDYDMIMSELQFVKNHIERVVAVKTGRETPLRCGHNDCDYCRLTKKAVIKHYKEFDVY